MPAHLMRGLAAALVVALAIGAARAEPTFDELRALRFYIEQNDEAAVAAELRRLRTLHPGWTPPADLTTVTATAPAAEVEGIYRLIASGDAAGARAALARTRAAYPGWVVPADLLRQIDTAEAQGDFNRAVAAGDLARALAAATATPDLLRCDRVNNVWQIAELQVAAGDRARALAAYAGVVRTCPDPAVVEASIEKADSLATQAEIEGLLDEAARRFPARSAQIAALRTRLLAGRGIAPPPAAAAAAGTAPATRPPAAATAAAAAPPRPAAPPPSAAVAPPPPARAAAPLASLPRSGDGRLRQVRAAAQAGAYAQCLAASTRPRSLDVAYERAWCAYNLDRPLEAAALFAAAAEGGLGGTVQRDARFGLALAYLAAGMSEDAARVAAATDFTRDQRRQVEAIILNQRGVAAYRRGDYARAIAFFDALEALEGSLTRDIDLLRGYAYLNSGDRDRARQEFVRMNRTLATPDTRRALEALGE
jgi:tetratricopeptide (TPR) repeat protein